MPDAVQKQLDRCGDVLVLDPQIVVRFYTDGNRLGQRRPGGKAPKYDRPERWLASSTAAVNPPGVPGGGLSTWASAPKGNQTAKTLRDLLAHDQYGPRLLGQPRHQAHDGQFRVLLKLLDAAEPIAFHVHADDRFVANHPDVYPGQRFGKDEAYHFLAAPKGACPYTQVGLYKGVRGDDILEAVARGTEYVLELGPAIHQRIGEGFFVRAGILHRPGTALTLEIQQPSDVYAFFQNEWNGKPIPPATQHPGFETLADALATVNIKANHDARLIDKHAIKPRRIDELSTRGAMVEWVFPPSMSEKFSGQRLTVARSLKFKASDPCALFVWSGSGTLNGQPIRGTHGTGVGGIDEFFIGIEAARRGVTLESLGDEPLIAFALYPAQL